MVRVPRHVKERLDRMAELMLESYEAGRGYQDVEITEQGSKGVWVPLHAVITRALDELEDHRTRSNKKRVKPQAA
jgi:hypothetical protein